MIGPSPDQHRTCNSGEICSFQQLTGHALQAADLVALMDTCGVSMGHRFPELGQFLSSHGHESLGPTSLSAAGGRYRLCWCSSLYLSSCSTMEGFNVDAGELLVLGPRPLTKDMTCVSGQSCTLLDLTSSEMLPSSTISGIAALNTCGVPDPEHQASHAFPLLRPSDSSGTRLTWDVQVPGQYRLCWCSSEDSEGCRVIESFQVDIGALTVLGPYPLQVTCMSGQLCMAEIFGLGLKDDDDIFVLDTCSETETEKPGFLHSKLHKAEGFLPEAPEAPVVWELLTWNTITALGGEYRLCWCPRSSACIESGADRWNFGSLTVIGPSGQKTQHTCVSGQTCELDAIPGQYLAKVSKVTILETCGVVSVDHSYEERWNWTGRLVAPETLVGAGGMIVWDEKLKGPGGQYRLCWCGDDREDACSLHTDFLMDFASLQILGPRPLVQDRTCVAGRTCFLESFTGEGLTSADRVWLLDTCGSTVSPVQRLISTGLHQPGLHMSELVISLKGGQYRLCWCHGLTSNCAFAEDFQVDFGRLDVIGVAPLSQDRSCISGHHCAIDGIMGHYLDSKSHLLILDTCGTASAFSALRTSGNFERPASVASSGASWNALVTLPGGQYRLCWCHTEGNLSTCELPEHFQVDFGNFMLVGPSPLEQHRTCVSGEVCLLSGIHGEALSESNVVVIMDTCGDATSGTPPARLFASLSVLDGMMLTTQAPLTFVGGEYRLCWCSGHTLDACNVTSSFATDLGRLDLLGPRPLQDRTCVSGLTCILDGLTGHGLSGSDAILLLETCGVETSIDRFTFGGADVSSSGARSSWERQIVAGGVYRLCWRAHGGANSSSSTTEGFGDPTEFRVDIGGLTMIGATLLDQDRTCISGHTCQIDGVRGLHFSQLDAVFILDTCSLGTVVPLWPEAGVATELSVAGATISWGPTPVSAAGGEYRLCWCSGAARMMNTSAEILCGHDDFQGTRGLVDIGRMTLLGLAPLEQHRTCIAGRTCTVDGILGGLSSDLFTVADTCGTDASLHRFPGFGLASTSQNASMVTWGAHVSSSGGQYRLCWCSGEDGALDRCTRLEHFVVDAGRLEVVGPLHGQEGTCVSGHRCLLSGIQGHHLQTGDQVFILDTCSHFVRPPRMPGPTFLANEPESRNHSAERRILEWEFISSAGGEYRLCWYSALCEGASEGSASCYSSGNGRGSLVDLVDFGRLQLLGPASLSLERTCMSGQSCHLGTITGLGLSDADRILVMETCGASSTIPNLPADGVILLTTRYSNWSASPSGLAMLNTAPWTDPVTAAAGRYRMCWCSSLGDCETGDDVPRVVDIGLFMLIGPTPLSQDRTCFSGQLCNFEVNGIGMDLGSSLLMLLHTCGSTSLVTDFETGHELSPFSLNQTHFEVRLLRKSAVEIPSGGYRLCWCAGEPFGCTSSIDFKTDIGSLHVVGPVRMQERTCISGQTCTIRDIMGVQLGDAISLLDTCGEESVIPRFPSFGHVQRNAGTATVSFPVVSAAGGSYQLCWCPKDFHCEVAEDFRVPLGQLLLLGPSPLTQARTCVSGSTCSVEPLEGQVSSHILR